jgi:UDP-N-acetyl-D-mannosaminuronic acid dehydrogenase
VRVCVFGLGYIGLPTAVVMAAAGHEVVGFDLSPAVREALRAGRAHISEAGLDEMLARVHASGALTISDAPVEADAFVLAVPTPIRGDDHRADLSAVEAAATAAAPLVRAGNLVVLESTAPPGTTAGRLREILEQGSGLRAGSDFLLAHCPERVIPGRILYELVENDRIVGGIDAASAEAARALYAPFVRGELHLTDATTAELVKLMENTSRDVNIALSNEFALVAERVGVDVWEAIGLANRHPRISMLRPGPGVGGHCIAVDPWFVIGVAPHLTPLIAASRAVNDGMPRHVAELAAELLGGLRGKVIVALGLTYKADVDDTRESPAAEVVELLEHAGAEVRRHDAHVRADQPVEALAEGADLLVLLVDHRAYAGLDPAALAARMRLPTALDTRNVLPRAPWEEAGFRLARLGDGRARAITPAGVTLSAAKGPSPSRSADSSLRSE